MKEKFKKGDIVCIYEKYTRIISENIIIETTVASSGEKWITTSYYRQNNKFNSETLSSDWGGYALFHGNKEECYEYLIRLKESEEMCRKITHYLDRTDDFDTDDFDLVKQIYQLIFGTN